MKNQEDRKRLERVEDKVGRLEEKVDRVETRVDRIEVKLDGVCEDVEVLKTDVEVLKTDVKHLKQGQDRLNDNVAFLLTAVNENHKAIKAVEETVKEYRSDMKRYFDVQREHHEAQMRVLGEAYGLNRERLDDHEVRIQRLEAS